MGDTIELFVADEQDDFPVDVERLSLFARNVLADEQIVGEIPGTIEVSLLFVTELTITDLNVRFRDKEGPTDVLSFPLDEPVPGGRWPDRGTRRPTDEADEEEGGDMPPTVMGDVVICPEVAHRNAPEHAGTYPDEMALLVVHGLLHLLGMDHEDDEEAEAMEAREQELLDSHWRSAAGGAGAGGAKKPAPKK